MQIHLSLRNLILQPDAPPVLLDWGTAATGPVPHGELLSLLRTHHATGEPTADDLGRFAEGLDLSLTDDRETLLDLPHTRGARPGALGHRLSTNDPTSSPRSPAPLGPTSKAHPRSSQDIHGPTTYIAERGKSPRTSSRSQRRVLPAAYDSQVMALAWPGLSMGHNRVSLTVVAENQQR